MLTLELSAHDVALLRNVLRSRLATLTFEIDHTDSRVFREELRKQAESVERLIGRLPASRPTG